MDNPNRRGSRRRQGMTQRTFTVDLPASGEQTTVELDAVGESPTDPSCLRVKHAEATVEVQTDRDRFFDVFTRFAQYDQWAPEVQGSAHWLTIRDGGVGSKFIAYDKPGKTHLAHYGEVMEVDRPARFVWRAPFSEWQRAYVGTVFECEQTNQGTTAVTETFYFDVSEDHLCSCWEMSLLAW